jgi:cellulose synthase/poly-beta-1,6-N-acetylglucosamine synthase-like glycosyltransferase
MIIISGIILALYCFLLIAFIIGFDKIENFKVAKFKSKTKFSIIVPFRNEAENLQELLISISTLDYPKELFEIILVNDDSVDDSVLLINNFTPENDKLNIKILTNIRRTKSPKKDAIQTAILQSNFDWVITTDADCIVPKNWLKIFDAYIQKHKSKLIAAPVTYLDNKTFLEQFQLLDFLSLQASTIGSYGIHNPILCNGANLCYQKQAFIQVNGFEGNENIASGDDIFLLEKIVKQYPNEVRFLKSNEVIVKTQPQPTFKGLLSQRIRWAAKTTAYTNNFAKFVGVTVLLMNLMLIMSLLLTIFNLFKWEFFFAIITIKLLLDFILLNRVFRFFKQKILFQYYFIGSLVYPIFSMFVAIASFQTTFNWKDRVFKK